MDSNRLSKVDYFLQIVPLVATRSTCSRRAVGCIITDIEGHVLSMGYNGVPKDFVHCIDHPCPGASDGSGDNSNCIAVHAEQNALLQCSNLNRAYYLYVSCTPCFICAKMIANTNIKQIIVLEPYADGRGVDILKKAGIDYQVRITIA